MSSSESSSEYSSESAEETLENVYVHLLRCIGQMDGLETDIDWADAFRWNDAKLDAAALALYAVGSHVNKGDGRFKAAQRKAERRLAVKFVSELERAHSGGRKRRR